MNRVIKGLLVVVTACMAAAAFGAGNHDKTATVSGAVQSGELGLGSYRVSVYGTKGNGRRPHQPLASTQTDSEGYFQLGFKPSPRANTVYYLVADNPHNGITRYSNVRLATVLDSSAKTDGDLIINERTTVAVAYALALFIDDKGSLGGAYPGLQNGAATVQNLVNLYSEEMGDVLGSEPNGALTTTHRTHV